MYLFSYEKKNNYKIDEIVLDFIEYSSLCTFNKCYMKIKRKKYKIIFEIRKKNSRICKYVLVYVYFASSLIFLFLNIEF